MHPYADRAAVLSLVQRGGKVRSIHVERLTQDKLKPILNEYLAEGVHVVTDSNTMVKLDDPAVKHDRVNHSVKEYVRYVNGVWMATNTVEGYFATLKRGIDRVYHHVGRQHLKGYLNEVIFDTILGMSRMWSGQDSLSRESMGNDSPTRDLCGRQ